MTRAYEKVEKHSRKMRARTDSATGSYFVRVSDCLGGIRISNLHTFQGCGALNRANSTGTLMEIDPAELPPVIREALKLCSWCVPSNIIDG